MANKQSVPATVRGGGALRGGVKNVTLTASVKRELPVNNTLEAVISGAGMAKAGVGYYDKYLQKQQQYKADQLMQENRLMLQNAQSEDEFDSTLKNFETSFKGQFAEDEQGKNFWGKNGAELLGIHRRDAKRILASKQGDFAKTGLTVALMENQKRLASSVGDKGALLLDEGLSDIAETPFLDDGEKEDYRKGFIRNGVLNWALNDPKAALEYAEKNMPEGDDKVALKNRLVEAEKLRERVIKVAEEEDARKQKIGDYWQQMKIWAEKERGNINDAEFFVMTAEDDKDGLWALREEKTSTPLGQLYRTARRLGKGEKISAEEARDAGNFLISAYKQDKMSLDEVADLQEKLMNSVVNGSDKGQFFDSKAAELADLVLMPDAENNESGEKTLDEFMEKKAKLAFEINDIYKAKKEALAGVFLEQGGKMTPVYDRRISQQALRETRDELGLVENGGDAVSFGSLKRLLGNYFVSGGESDVWQRFCDEAPYADDKKALFKRIAADVERKVLAYPQFDTYAEVENAGLEKGEKFYLRGRLAVKA